MSVRSVCGFVLANAAAVVTATMRNRKPAPMKVSPKKSAQSQKSNRAPDFPDAGSMIPGRAASREATSPTSEWLLVQTILNTKIMVPQPALTAAEQACCDMGWNLRITFENSVRRHTSSPFAGVHVKICYDHDRGQGMLYAAADVPM